MKINKEDFTYTTDYVWCMEVVVLFRTTTEGCDQTLLFRLKLTLRKNGSYIIKAYEKAGQQMVSEVVYNFVWGQFLLSKYVTQQSFQRLQLKNWSKCRYKCRVKYCPDEHLKPGILFNKQIISILRIWPKLNWIWNTSKGP